MHIQLQWLVDQSVDRILVSNYFDNQFIVYFFKSNITKNQTFLVPASEGDNEMWD